MITCTIRKRQCLIFLDSIGKPFPAVGFLCQLEGWDEQMTRAEGRVFFEKNVIPHCISPLHDKVWTYFDKELIFVDDNEEEAAEPVEKKIKV